MKTKAGPAHEIHRGVTKPKTLCHHLHINDGLVHCCFIGCELKWGSSWRDPGYLAKPIDTGKVQVK